MSYDLDCGHDKRERMWKLFFELTESELSRVDDAFPHGIGLENLDETVVFCEQMIAERNEGYRQD